MDAISDIAARWAVRVDAGAMGEAERGELQRWLDEDQRHRGAFVRACAQWADLDRLAALHGPATIPGEGGALATGAPSPPISPALARSVASRRWLLAASVAALAVAGSVAWQAMGIGAVHYASGVGEVRRIALEDGSTLMLNTASEVTVRMRAHERDIRLVRGEALFEVAHDKTRPFIVQADGTAVRAVGTAFAVRLEPRQVDVTVTEGVVEVGDSTALAELARASPAAAAPHVRRVMAHQRAVIVAQRAPDIEPIAPIEVDRQLAWREGMVSFDGETLQAAVEEVNRHNRRQIVIDDAVLAAKPVVGVFRATDVEGFSAAAAAALKARAVTDGDVVHLQAAEAPRR